MITIYPASDDLLEIEGDIQEEFNVYGGARIEIYNAEGTESLRVVTEMGCSGWRMSVESDGSYPSWPMYFKEREDREGDPALVIDTPPGVKVELLETNRFVRTL